MKLLTNTHYNFMNKAKLFVISSIILLVAMVGVLNFKGLNYGIDFAGGILVEVKVKDGVSIADLRSKLSPFENIDASLQEFGSSEDILIRASVDGTEIADGTKIIKNAISSLVEEFRRTEFVGPVVGEELKENAVWAVIYALIAMMFYIWVRFEWQYGLSALIALFHDVIITIGFISITGIELGLPAVAAILTIAGYSINDTVVIFDRVRENFSKYNKKSYKEVFDLAVNQSLSRTIMTSVTTLLALLALYFFGGAAIEGFTLAMIFGVIIGTYSSNCVAVPLLLWLKPNRDDEGEFIDPIQAKFKQEQQAKSLNENH